MAPIFKTTISLLFLSTLALANPISQRVAESERPAENENQTTVATYEAIPQLYPLYPTQPDFAQDNKWPGIHMEVYDRKSQVEMAVVFPGIPAGAKDCKIGLRQADKFNRIYVAKMNASAADDFVTDLYRLSGFPADNEPKSYNAIQKFMPSEPIRAGMDFALWDTAEFGYAWNHGTTAIDCAETIYFKLVLRNIGDEKNMFMQQTAKNGLYIKYSL